METANVSALAHWESFYVIVGTSAAALTGLQFVVIVLIGELRLPGSMATVTAFGTPTVMHFGAALLISAVLSAPWPTLTGAGLALVAIGVAGVVYALVTTRRALQTEYQPVAEDWVWHVCLPFTSYAAVLVAGIFVSRWEIVALFAVGG